MAKEWEALKALNDEENQRLHQKKLRVALMLQDALERLMDIFLMEGNWGNMAPALRDIETIWQVLDLEYVVASEAAKIDHERGKEHVARMVELWREANREGKDAG